jgi:hypothetical protein
MAKALTKAQKNVLKEMFSGKTETEALASVKISSGLYRKWLRSKEWKEAFEERMEGCRRQAQLILSNFLVYAATKLINLAGCDKEPVARQACLDILEMKPLVGEKTQNTIEEIPTKMSEKTAETIMRVLADRKEQVSEMNPK